MPFPLSEDEEGKGGMRGGSAQLWDHRRSSIGIIDDGSGACSWELLVPSHIIAIANVRAASSARDGDSLAQGPRHGGRLSQHRLGPGPCKGERHREGDALFYRKGEKSEPMCPPRIPSPFPISSHLCSKQGV